MELGPPSIFPRKARKARAGNAKPGETDAWIPDAALWLAGESQRAGKGKTITIKNVVEKREGLDVG